MALDGPICDRANDMALIEGAEHHLNFIAGFSVRLRHKKVDSATARLIPFTTDYLQLTKAKQRRVFRDPVL